MPPRLLLRLVVARHRRAVVAVLLALAVASAVQALRPAPPATTRVLVAARDLPAGHRLTARDLTGRAWPAGAAPAGLVALPAGRVLATPLRRGEPVTDVRVAAAGRSAAGGHLPSGWVAVTVRLTDPAATLLVVPGDRVEVIAGAATDPLAGASSVSGAAGATSAARVVVDDAVVLTPPGGTGAGGGSGRSSPRGGGSAGPGLLGAFEGGRPADGDTNDGDTNDADTNDADTNDADTNDADTNDGRDAGLPAGVLVLGLPDAAALDLAAVTGVRSLTLARKLASSG